MGLGAQFRTMGSAFALAIVTSAFNGYTSPRLQELGHPASIATAESLISEQLAGLPSTLVNDVRHILSEGYSRQMLVLCAFSAAQVPVALLMWKRKQIIVT
jgi:hypothetical protein